VPIFSIVTDTLCRQGRWRTGFTRRTTMSRDNIISFLDNVGSARQRVADAKLNELVGRLRELTSTVCRA
jgi:hypothetical protein